MAVETNAQERENEPVGDFGAPASSRPEGYFSHPRRMARLIALVALAALSAVWWGGHVWYRKSLLTERRGEILAELDPYGNALIVQNRLRFALLRALRAFVETHYSSRTFAADFEIFARGLVEGLPGIRTLTVAPRGIQRFVYPLTGNETVAGHDLLRDPRPDVRADVARAIESRKPVVSGPYELRQGGVGVVARLAIHRGKDFWGLATVDVDVSLLLAETGITKTGKLRMALRDEQGRVFFGEPAVFESDPLIHRIDLPDGHWDLSAIPDKGWNAAIERNLAIFDGLAFAILLLLTGLVAILVDRDARLALLVQQRTRGLNAELEQRKKIETQLRQIEERYRTLVRSEERRVGKECRL